MPRPRRVDPRVEPGQLRRTPPQTHQHRPGLPDSPGPDEPGDEPDERTPTVEVKIGVQNVAREITFETDDTPDEVAAAVEKALASGERLSLTDTKGRRILVPGAALGWVQIGESEKGRVGFGVA